MNIPTVVDAVKTYKALRSLPYKIIIHSGNAYPVRCSNYLCQAQYQLWSQHQLELLVPTPANKPCSDTLLAQAQPYTVHLAFGPEPTHAVPVGTSTEFACMFPVPSCLTQLYPA